MKIFIIFLLTILTSITAFSGEDTDPDCCATNSCADGTAGADTVPGSEGSTELPDPGTGESH